VVAVLRVTRRAGVGIIGRRTSGIIRIDDSLGVPKNERDHGLRHVCFVYLRYLLLAATRRNMDENVNHARIYLVGIRSSTVAPFADGWTKNGKIPVTFPTNVNVRHSPRNNNRVFSRRIFSKKKKQKTKR